jgi:L-alanine-DL-glutamate epimerase-like enolase superfamily enzyme
MKTPWLTRRSFLAAIAAPTVRGAVPNPRDARIEEVDISEESYRYRTPIKFGGAVVDRVTLLNVRVVLRGRQGATAEGFGSMPLGNVWSFPSRTLKYDDTLGAMRQLAAQIRTVTAGHKDFGHPIELNHHLEPEWLRQSDAVAEQRKLAQPIPKLATLVTASPFDAAIHDAYGKLHRRSAYATLSREFLREDLGRYLGDEFRGLRLDRFVRTSPQPAMPLYHLVGAVDPLTDDDVQQRVGDGLPETLPEWIRYSGLTHIKIKLNGDDLAWDRDRVLGVERTTAPVMQGKGTTAWSYSLDFNEKCPNVDYLLDMLRQVRERAPAAFGRIQYIEQPTARDLKANRANVMHAASKLKPVVIDESLTDLESLKLAREMGYTGAALKACKGQSQALLMAAAAQHWKMFLCVQDLTCPGASLIHSAGLAAHVPGVAAIEANARQYVPAANASWTGRFPGLFDVRDGAMRTGQLTGPGLSAVAVGEKLYSADGGTEGTEPRNSGSKYCSISEKPDVHFRNRETRPLICIPGHRQPREIIDLLSFGRQRHGSG